MNWIADTLSDGSLIGQSQNDVAGSRLSFELPDTSDVSLGQRLVRYRSRSGFSESDVAESLGISINYVRLIEWDLICHVSPQLNQRIMALVQDNV